MCCRTMGVRKVPRPDNPEVTYHKPGGEDCPHVCATGCAIYADRPEGCVKFECYWLQNPRVMKLRTHHRPDRLGLMVWSKPLLGETVLSVSEKWPGAADLLEGKKLLKRLSRALPVLLMDENKRCRLLGPPDVVTRMKVKLLKQFPDTTLTTTRQM